MISKTKILKKARKKTNSELVETILLAKKNNHLNLAKKLAVPARKQPSINLNEINKINEKKIIFPGKILGQGEINKKISISALSFSKQAEEKLKKAGCKIMTIKNELMENPKLSEVKIIWA